MYIIEGNMGVGKSTLLTLFNNHYPDVLVVQEPVTQWTIEKHGNSLLSNFYKDIKRWAYTLETFTMITRTIYHLEAQTNDNPWYLMERSIYSGHYCFAKNGYLEGNLNHLEWKIYLEWVKFFLERHCKPPRGFIYLQASPETCFKRVQQRNRSAESTVSFAYIQQIHNRYEDLLIHKVNVAETIKHVPVLVLPSDQDLINNPEMIRDRIETVRSFMRDTM